MNPRPHLTAAVAFSLIFFGNSIGIGTIAAAERELEPMDLVAADVGVCIQLSGVGDRLTRFRQSPLFERLQSRTFYGDWLRSEHFQKLEQAKLSVERLAGQPFGQFADEVFGQTVVLAIFPAERDGKPIGVFFTQARNADILDSAIATWNRAEPNTTVELAHGNRAYFRRTPLREGGLPSTDQFYVKVGPVFALSDRETMIQRVIELAGNSPAADEARLVHSAAYQRAVDSAAKDSLATIYVNPRSWDSSFESQLAAAPLIATVWTRLESVIVTIRLEPALLVESVLHYDGATAGDVWSRFVERSQGAAALVDRVPDDALAAVSGRLDPTLINDVASQSFTGRQRDDWHKFRQVSRGLLLGHDLFDGVLSRFGASWVAYVVPRSPLQSGVLPFEALAAFELPVNEPPAGGEQPVSIRQSLDNALNTGLNVLAAAHNAESPQAGATVRQKSDGDVLIRWVDGIHSNQPTYALTAKYLLLATSPQTVAMFLDRNTAAPVAVPTRLHAVRSAHFPVENQLLFVNVAALREFVNKNRNYFVDEAKSSESLSQQDADTRIARFLDVVQLLDSAFIAGHLGPDRIRIVTGASLDERQFQNP